MQKTQSDVSIDAIASGFRSGFGEMAGISFCLESAIASGFRYSIGEMAGISTRGGHMCAFIYDYVKTRPKHPAPHDLSASQSEAARSECVVIEAALGYYPSACLIQQAQTSSFNFTNFTNLMTIASVVPEAAPALGSSSFITDATGYAVQHLQYLPFGETFVDQQNGYDSRYTFSAKELDDETQYSYFGARYYDSDLSIFISIDPASDQRSWISPYNYCQWNPVGRVDPSGALDEGPDNYTIFSDGTVEKEETTDNANTYTYVRSDGTKLDLGTYDKETNSKGEEMTKVGEGETGENNMLKWVGIGSGNMYYPEDGFALLLGAIQNFYDNTDHSVEKVTFNQFMSLERTHSTVANYPPSFDVLYYFSSGKVGALTDGSNLSDELNYQLLNTFKSFGIGVNSQGFFGSREYNIYSSKSYTSKERYFEGTSGWPKHNNHFHFSGFDNSRIAPYQTADQKGLNRLKNGL